MISFDDFKKLDIRIGTIVEAEKLPNSDKLLKLKLDFGTETRQILAGIAVAYPDPAVLVGKQVPVIVNLEPRTMRDEVSEGMMLAADGGGVPTLLHPAVPTPSGSTVR